MKNTVNTKICITCKEVKSLDEFHKSKTSKDGRVSNCKLCAIVRSRKWREDNLDRARAYDIWRFKNQNGRKESLVKTRNQHYQNNKADYKAKAKEWAADNRAKSNAMKQRCSGARKIATPSWADYDKIKQIYLLAAITREVTGCDVHVDHIIPLNNKVVCGLHVSANLRIIPAEQNFSKGNRFSPYADND